MTQTHDMLIINVYQSLEPVVISRPSHLILLCPFLATMSFAGYFLIVVAFCLLSLLFFSERVPGLIWFGSVYLVTAAGFVADQLIM